MSHSSCQHCQSRRQFLSTGLILGAGLILPDWSFAGGFSHSLGDKVWVNGRLAHQNSRINANSIIKTGAQDTSFIIGNNAFKLRANSEVKFTALKGRKTAISTLRLITGSLLSAFGAGNKKLITNTATIGIRGTAVYMETQAQSSYVCLCYGKVDLAANQTPNNQTKLEATHHLGQLITDNGNIDNHAMQGHTDEELVELEALVGRKVPFVYPYTG